MRVRLQAATMNATGEVKRDRRVEGSDISLIVRCRRAGGREGGGAVARACLSIEEVVDVLVKLGVDGRDVVEVLLIQ